MHEPRISKGYRYVYAPESPSASKSESYRGYVFEHRLVMERVLGRALRRDECIHHIDLNKLNNSIENLIVLSNSDHTYLHKYIAEAGCIPEEVKGKDEIIRLIEVYKERQSTNKVKARKVCRDKGVEDSNCKHSNSVRYKIEWPRKEDLERLLTGDSIVHVASILGVSDKAVIKHCNREGIEYRNLVRKKGFTKEATEKSHSIESRRKLSSSMVTYFIEHRSACCKKIEQLDCEGNVVRVYDRIGDAEKYGFLGSPISRVCKGKRQSYKGFKWRYS